MEHGAAGPATSPLPCVVHGRYSHNPRPTYSELHHVIPQAWQLFLTRKLSELGKPAPPRYTGEEPVQNAPGLWDPRVVSVCPTGHRNIHYMLVRAMREYEVQPGHMEHPTVWIEDSWRAAKLGKGWNRKEIPVAKLAMYRFEAAGGSLLNLCKNGLYGEA